jgi:hypothetical protein
MENIYPTNKKYHAYRSNSSSPWHTVKIINIKYEKLS